MLAAVVLSSLGALLSEPTRHSYHALRHGQSLANVEGGSVVVHSVAQGSLADKQGVPVRSMLRAVNSKSISDMDAASVRALIGSLARPVTLRVAPREADHGPRPEKPEEASDMDGEPLIR